MMDNYIEISIQPGSPGQSEILIARLGDAGFEGFEEKEDRLLAFIPEQRYRLTEMQDFLSRLAVSFSERIIPPLNWNREWERNFEPVLVGTFCHVRADFHLSRKDVKYELIITPKMSFGTGHHATTWMMIHAMEGLDFRDRQVFDFGTGTGILAILAEKLGAAQVIAVDNDPQCILNASENIVDNQCNKIVLKQQDLIGESVALVDVLLANINRNTILDRLGEMRQHLAPQGVLVLSGLMEEDLDIVLQTAAGQGLKERRRELKDSWVCVQLQLAQPPGGI